VFDVIRSCHVAVGHKKLQKRTKDKALSTYYNLTEDLCRIFIDKCLLRNSLTSGVGIPTLTMVDSGKGFPFVLWTILRDP